MERDVVTNQIGEKLDRIGRLRRPQALPTV